MNRIFQLYSGKAILLGLLVIAASCNPSTKENKEKETPSVFTEKVLSEGEKRIDVYYFHNRMRCPSCIALEETAQKTIYTSYPGMIEQGSLTFHILSMDTPRNQWIAEKYQAFGPTLIVSKKNGQQEEIIDLTGDGFRYAMRDEARFASIIKNTIEQEF
ncbi:MAG: hypothetical protein EA361_08905 [Bacteroidetes bacterium]|nr:MAG: hypothetical protein EA361_08905 [Bacteroidota bacterium]